MKLHNISEQTLYKLNVKHFKKKSALTAQVECYFTDANETTVNLFAEFCS